MKEKARDKARCQAVEDIQQLVRGAGTWGMVEGVEAGAAVFAATETLKMSSTVTFSHTLIPKSIRGI